MKIDAIVCVSCPRQNLQFSTVRIAVDADYVEPNYDDIIEYIRNSKELEQLCKANSLCTADCELEVLNMDDLIEDLTYEDFCDATNADYPKWS
jgi:hypothetical protein